MTVEQMHEILRGQIDSMQWSIATAAQQRIPVSEAMTAAIARCADVLMDGDLWYSDFVMLMTDALNEQTQVDNVYFERYWNRSLSQHVPPNPEGSLLRQR